MAAIFGELFGLLLLALRFSSTLQEPTEKSCVAAAICQMVRGNVHAALGLKTDDEMHEEALKEFKQREKYEVCKIDKINENCEKRKGMCEMKIMDAAKTYGLAKKLGLDEKILAKCEIKTWHYMLFLCDMKNWPEDVKSKIPKDYPLCKQICTAMAEFNTYHESKGKTKADFPDDWEFNLNYAKNMTPSMQGRNFETERDIYTYVEYDENAVGQTYPTLMCPEGTFLTDEKGDPLYFITFNPERFKCADNYTLSISVALLAVVQSRGVMIAAQFRRQKKSRETPSGNIILDELVDGRYVYGHGEREFVDKEGKPFKTVNFEGWGSIMECPYTTAVCTIQITRYVLPNGIPVPTNIRLGCCVVPDEKLWVATAYVSVLYGKGQQKTLLDDDIHTRVRLYQYQSAYRDLEKEYFCPPGQFIDKFQAAVYYSPGKVSQELFHFNAVQNVKTLVFLETEFYCNTRDKSFPSRILSEDLKKYRPFDKYVLWHELGTYSCDNGFFTQVKLSVGSSGWGKYLHCSADKPDVWLGSEWDTPGWPTSGRYYVNDYKGGEGTASCPPGHALCGIGAKRFRGKYPPPRDWPEMPQTDISMEGHFYRFFCCKVENIERCDNPKITIPRIVNQCPDVHVSRPTQCWVSWTTGTSYTQTNTSGMSKSSTVDRSFMLTPTLKIEGIVNVAGKYSRGKAETRGFSWSTALADGNSTGETAQTRYEIPAGSKLITAQPQLKCGPYLLHANQTIGYVTPPIACIATDSYNERIVRTEDRPKEWDGKFNLTINGYGLELVAVIFPPSELGVSWAELTEFLPGAFVNNSNLMAHRWTDFDWTKVENEVWGKYDEDYLAYATFDVKKGSLPKFYTVVATCGNWTVRTKEVRMLDEGGSGPNGTVSNEDRARLVKPLYYYESVNGEITLNKKLSTAQF